MESNNTDPQTKLDPFNITIMDVEHYISEHRCLPITSHSVHAASSSYFHPDGLFSEEIFGQIGTGERLVTFGYITLNTKILQPVVYKSICKLKQIYAGIINGSTYAKFDDDIEDFVRCQPDDIDGKTGYSFFITNFHKVKLSANNSPQRKARVDMLNKYRDYWFINKLLVLPAGVRDIKTSDVTISQEDINKLYLAVLSYSAKIPINTNNPIYDGVRAALLKKIVEIYEYIENIISGKKGFLRGNLSKRTIAGGARNVLSSAKINMASPGDVRGFKSDETLSPLYMTMKSFQPVLIYHLKRSAFEDIFSAGSTQVSLIDTKTYKLSYKEISSETAETYKTIEGIGALIANFKATENRHGPIIIKDIDNKDHYLYLIYDTGDTIFMFRNISDLDKLGIDIDKKYIRPLTWLELFYMTTYNAVIGKHVYITRYPIGQGHDSCYPSKIRLMSTKPNREVTLIDPNNPETKVVLPHYPIMDQPCIDSLGVFPGRLPGLAGDYDGDVVSANSVMSTDVNLEIDEYLNSWRSIITPQQKFYSGGNTGLIQASVFNLSRDPAEA